MPVAPFGAVADGPPLPKRAIKLWINPAGHVCPIGMWDHAAPKNEDEIQRMEAEHERQLLTRRDAQTGELEPFVPYVEGDPECQRIIAERRTRNRTRTMEAALQTKREKQDLVSAISKGNEPLVARIEAALDRLATGAPAPAPAPADPEAGLPGKRGR